MLKMMRFWTKLDRRGYINILKTFFNAKVTIMVKENEYMSGVSWGQLV